MSGGFLNSNDFEDLKAVPLFPLPNVVLFPNALLPLHVFEERYKAMTADALAGRRQIAMALLSPGWEKRYDGRPAIAPVVCLGTIVRHERFEDGRFNFLLRGEMRARIATEFPVDSCGVESPLYRLAHLTRLHETQVMEIDLSHERERFETILSEGPLAKIPLVREFRSMLRGVMRTADFADLVAFHLLDDVPLKQSILADGDIRGRVNRLLTALNAFKPPTVDHSIYHSAAPADPMEN